MRVGQDLILNMFDDPEILLVAMRGLVDRIVQEEVWSQTVWPEGEPVLTQRIVANLGGWRDAVLEEARARLGVGRLGWE